MVDEEDWTAPEIDANADAAIEGAHRGREERGARRSLAELEPPEDRLLVLYRQERTRGRIALVLAAALGFVAGVIALAVFTGWSDRDALELLITGVFSPLAALVGAVGGYYFGKRS